MVAGEYEREARPGRRTPVRVAAAVTLAIVIALVVGVAWLTFRIDAPRDFGEVHTLTPRATVTTDVPREPQTVPATPSPLPTERHGD